QRIVTLKGLRKLTAPNRLQRFRTRPRSGLRRFRPDVGVQTEKVGGVVLLLELLQAVVVAAVGSAHTLVVFAGPGVHVETVSEFPHSGPHLPRRLDMGLVL